MQCNILARDEEVAYDLYSKSNGVGPNHALEAANNETVAGVPFCVYCKCHVVTQVSQLSLLEAFDRMADRSLRGNLKFDLGRETQIPDLDDIKPIGPPLEVNSLVAMDVPSNEVEAPNPQDDAKTKTERSSLLKIFTGSSKATVNKEAEVGENNKVEIKKEAGVNKESEVIETDKVSTTAEMKESNEGLKEMPSEIPFAPSEMPSEMGIEAVPTDTSTATVDDDNPTSNIVANPSMSDSVVEEYNVRRDIATKILGAKMLQGYILKEDQCDKCGMPTMEHHGVMECVVCPVLIKRAKKKKGEEEAARLAKLRDEAETAERILQSEVQILEHSEKQPPLDEDAAARKAKEDATVAARELLLLAELRTKAAAQKEREERHAYIEHAVRTDTETNVTLRSDNSQPVDGVYETTEKTEGVEKTDVIPMESRETKESAVSTSAEGNLTDAATREMEALAIGQKLLEKQRLEMEALSIGKKVMEAKRFEEKQAAQSEDEMKTLAIGQKLLETQRLLEKQVLPEGVISSSSPTQYTATADITSPLPYSEYHPQSQQYHHSMPPPNPNITKELPSAYFGQQPPSQPQPYMQNKGQHHQPYLQPQSQSHSQPYFHPQSQPYPHQQTSTTSLPYLQQQAQSQPYLQQQVHSQPQSQLYLQQQHQPQPQSYLQQRSQSQPSFQSQPQPYKQVPPYYPSQVYMQDSQLQGYQGRTPNSPHRNSTYAIQYENYPANQPMATQYMDPTRQTQQIGGNYNRPPRSTRPPRVVPKSFGRNSYIDDDVSLLNDDFSVAKTVASDALGAILGRMEIAKTQLVNSRNEAEQAEHVSLIEKLANAAVSLKKLEENL